MKKQTTNSELSKLTITDKRQGIIMLGQINLISLVVTPVVFYVASAGIVMLASQFKTSE